MDDIYKRVTNFANETYESVRKPQDGWSLILLIITIALTVYVVVYVYSEYSASSLVTKTILEEPVKVGNTKVENINAETAIPASKNGNEFSLSFWTFVENETSESTASAKFILGRMSGASNSGTASPRFVMDSTTNELLLQVVTNTNNYHVIKGGYLPMQRWVNILLVIENNYVQLFVDGELRNVQDVDGVVTLEGNLYIGGSGGVAAAGSVVAASVSQSIQGFISKVQAFNYALTIDHAKIIYRKGPLTSNILSSIGIPMYGIRNPFYDISTVDSCSS
jgi:hypothetical protein